MELRDSGRTISFVSRIIYQIPTIAISTLTMIAISRHLGPSGRGEVSQILLLAALASSVLCTPIFLTIMNLANASEIKSYVSRSLYLFSRNNAIIIALVDIFLLFFNQTNSHKINISMIGYVDLLIISYFISAQIRDLLLRFHRNKIFGVDFGVQIFISGPIFLLLLIHKLNVIQVIQVFTFTYGLYALFLLLLLKSRVEEFSFVSLIKEQHSVKANANILRISSSFSRSGLLFQIVLSKDLLLGLALLSKADFGLMSALTSFWFVMRFLRPSAVVQAKLGQGSPAGASSKLRLMEFISRPSSAIYLQAASIGIMGFLSFVLTPILMGKGFKPGIDMSISGALSEILLMMCLYKLSISNERYSENTFILVCLLQVLALGVLGSTGVKISISLIWFSSSVVYSAWQFINRNSRNK